MICHVTPTVMDGIVVRWNPTPDGDAEISASRNGVLIQGHHQLISSSIEMADLHGTLDLAWSIYQYLAGSRHPRSADVEAWLRARGVEVVDVHFGESLAEAMNREAKEQKP